MRNDQYQYKHEFVRGWYFEAHQLSEFNGNDMSASTVGDGRSLTSKRLQNNGIGEPVGQMDTGPHCVLSSACKIAVETVLDEIMLSGGGQGGLAPLTEQEIPATATRAASSVETSPTA